MGKHSLYDESPHMEHDAHGKVHVKKSETAAENKSAGQTEKGVKDEGFNVDESHHAERMHMHHRHVKERLDLHNRHAIDHMHHGPGPRNELHKRHENDLKALHGRHESEMKDMHSHHDKHAGAMGGQTTDEPIEKVEKGAK